MPYKLRKAPKKNLYWVVSIETGKKHSLAPIPLKRAEAQMRALYRSVRLEGGADDEGYGDANEDVQGDRLMAIPPPRREDPPPLTTLANVLTNIVYSVMWFGGWDDRAENIANPTPNDINGMNREIDALINQHYPIQWRPRFSAVTLRQIITRAIRNYHRIERGSILRFPQAITRADLELMLLSERSHHPNPLMGGMLPIFTSEIVGDQGRIVRPIPTRNPHTLMAEYPPPPPPPPPPRRPDTPKPPPIKKLGSGVKGGVFSKATFKAIRDREITGKPIPIPKSFQEPEPTPKAQKQPPPLPPKYIRRRGGALSSSSESSIHTDASDVDDEQIKNEVIAIVNGAVTTTMANNPEMMMNMNYNEEAFAEGVIQLRQYVENAFESVGRDQELTQWEDYGTLSDLIASALTERLNDEYASEENSIVSGGLRGGIIETFMGSENGKGIIAAIKKILKDAREYINTLPEAQKALEEFKDYTTLNTIPEPIYKAVVDLLRGARVNTPYARQNIPHLIREVNDIDKKRTVKGKVDIPATFSKIGHMKVFEGEPEEHFKRGIGRAMEEMARKEFKTGEDPYLKKYKAEMALANEKEIAERKGKGRKGGNAIRRFFGKNPNFIKDNTKKAINAISPHIGYVWDKVDSLQGSGAAPPRNILQQIVRASYHDDPSVIIDGFTLVSQSHGLVFYNHKDTMVVGIRGTQDFNDMVANARIPFGTVKHSTRFNEDLNSLLQFQTHYPPHQYDYYGVAHSLGGVILDTFLEMGLLKNGVSYNPAIQRHQAKDEGIMNERIYHESDPLLAIAKPFLSVEPEIRKGMASYKEAHKLSQFEGGYMIGI